MKYLLLILSIFIFSQCSDDRVSSSSITRIVKNNSGYDITITDNEVGDWTVNEYVIEKNQIKEEAGTCYNSISGNYCEGIPWFHLIDSIHIIYDQKRLQKFCTQEKEQCYPGFNLGKHLGFLHTSLLSSHNGYEYQRLNGIKTFTYTFTEEDYNHAEEID